MSFSIDVKDELSRVEPNCKNCSKATLSALLKTLGTLSITGKNQYKVELSTENASIARFAIKYLHDLYNLDTEITMRRNVLHKGTNYLITVTSDRLLAALKDMGIVKLRGTKTISSIVNNVPQDFCKKDCCSAAYLRGLFMGSGYVSDPTGDFHFEIKLEHENVAKAVVKMLAAHDIKANYYERRNRQVVYIKSGQGISDFLAFCGGHVAVLAIENIRVVKSIRNDETRRANVDMANIRRSSHAAVDQLIMIRSVVEHFGTRDLSPALQEFITLRIKYPESSLKELGEAADPPLSKSAINGRLRRLEELAATIKLLGSQ